MNIKKFSEISYGKNYLLDKKKFVLKDGFYVYIGGFLTSEGIQTIQATTNHELQKVLQDFTIEAKVERDQIEISPLMYQSLQNNSLSKEEGINNMIPVIVSLHKLNIFNVLYNLNKILKTTNIHHKYYKEIEDILNIDLSKDIDQYKTTHKIENFINEKGGIYNPIIGNQLKKIEEHINKIVDGFSSEQKTLLLKAPYRPGWGEIHNNASDMLYYQYHTTDLNLIRYNEATQGLHACLLHFDKLLGGKGENIETIHDQVQKMFVALTQTIKSIKIKPENQQEINTIMLKIDDDIFTPFIDFLEENIQQDDPQIASDINDNIDNIYNSVVDIILLKNYEYENIDSLSVLGLYKQLDNYRTQDHNDSENIIFTLNTLSTCSAEELSQLPSEYKANILSIIVEYEDDDNLQRNTETLGALCENKTDTEAIMTNALEGEKYKLAALLRDLINN